MLIIGQGNVFREYCNANLGTEGDKMQTIIGNNSLFMVGVHIAHDCVIGDYVTFAPSVRCNGNISVGNNVYIGTNAVIYPGSNVTSLEIGDNVKIGAGSVIKKSVPANTLVNGNPAKVIKTIA